jgi:hypothetical protein
VPLLRRKRSSIAVTDTGTSTNSEVAAATRTTAKTQVGEFWPAGLTIASVASIGAGVSMVATTSTPRTATTARA